MARKSRTRLVGQKQLSLGAAMIPNKVYFRIGEVSQLTDTKAYVLRYWEGEFPTLKPVKSHSGHRLYRRQDVETIFEIKRLLHERGYTIEGARAQLSRWRSREGGREDDSGPPASRLAALDAQVLRAIKHELQAILTMLSSK